MAVLSCKSFAASSFLGAVWASNCFLGGGTAIRISDLLGWNSEAGMASTAMMMSSCLWGRTVDGDERKMSGGRASMGDLTRSIFSTVKFMIFVVVTGGSSRSMLGCWMGRLPQKEVSRSIL